MKVQPIMGSSYSGSLRGITASHNKGGLYFRGRTIPTNPNTSRQQVVRSIMAGLTDAWSSVLTEAQRQAWRDFAANTPYTDSIGNSITMSGLNAYIKGNTARLQADEAGIVSLSRVDAGPTTFSNGPGVLELTTFSGDFTTPPGTLSIAGALSAAAPVDGDVLLFVAPPQTAGTRYYKGPYQLATTAPITADSASFLDASIDLSVATEWAADTVPVAGWDALYIPLKLVTLYDDGRVGEGFRMLIQFTDATP